MTRLKSDTLLALHRQTRFSYPDSCDRKKAQRPGLRHPLLPIWLDWNNWDCNFQCLITLVACGFALLLFPDKAFAQSPISFPEQTRRELTQDEISRISVQLGRPARFWQNTGKVIGVSGRLSQEQLNYYRERDVSEVFLLNWINEFGVTPEENEELRALGVDLAVNSLVEVNAFHEAALADVVVIGKVEGRTGHPEGPYHSTFHVQVHEYWKNCRQLNTPIVDAKLLESGPRFHKGRIVEVDAKWEPDLKKGENVVLLLTPVPLSLINRLGSAAGSSGVAGVVRLEPEFGKIPHLIAFIENPRLIDPSFLQVFTAFKVVGNKAVKKIRTAHAPSETNVIGVEELSAKVRQMAAVQLPYCRSR